jgi:trans-aconitate methyltransferase
MKPPKFYGPDLAYIHDSGFLGFVRTAMPGLLGLFDRSVPKRGLIIDIGRGTGELAQNLTDKGRRALGVDISPGMLRLARRKAPRAGFSLSDWREYAPPPCEAIVAVGECFNYLRGTKTGPT